MHFTESCPSGRRSTIGNRVGVKSVSGVQIPDSPPAPSHGLLPPNGPCSIPCGGVAEWLNAAVSKTVYPVSPGTRVRIPPPPPVCFLSEPSVARFSLRIARTQHSKAPVAARLVAATARRGNRLLRQPLAAAKGGARRQQAAPRPPRDYRAGTLLEPNSIKQPQRAPRARANTVRPAPSGSSAFTPYAFPTSTVSRLGQVVTCRLSGIWSSVSHISAGKV